MAGNDIVFFSKHCLDCGDLLAQNDEDEMRADITDGVNTGTQRHRVANFGIVSDREDIAPLVVLLVPLLGVVVSVAGTLFGCLDLSGTKIRLPTSHSNSLAYFLLLDGLALLLLYFLGFLDSARTRLVETASSGTRFVCGEDVRETELLVAIVGLGRIDGDFGVGTPLVPLGVVTPLPDDALGVTVLALFVGRVLGQSSNSTLKHDGLSFLS